MTTNSNFRVKNGLEVTEQAVIDGITLSNSSGTFAATINQTIVNSSTIALITNIGSSTVVDAMNSYTGDSISVSGSPTYSTTQTKFDDYSWNNESNTNNYIEAFSGGGYDFSSMGSASNWTIDMWIYTKTGASGLANQTLVNGSGFGDGSVNIWFGIDGSTPLSGTLKAGNGGGGYTSGPTMPGTEAWHHVGVMRKSGVLYFLLNGTTTAVSGNPTLAFGAGLQFLGGENENSFGLGYASRIRVAPATALFGLGTYALPVETDYDPAGSISGIFNALDYNSLANKPTQGVNSTDSPTFVNLTLSGGDITHADNNASISLDNSEVILDAVNNTNIRISGLDVVQFFGDKIALKQSLEFADETVQTTAATAYINPYGTTSTKLTVAGIALEGANTSTLKLSYISSGNDTPSSILLNSVKLTPISTGTATTITGVVGEVIAIETTGKLAYWDGTNSRWSYVSDDSAV